MINPPLYPLAKIDEVVGRSEPGTLAQRNTIVLHITEGSSAAGAIATFRASVHPDRVSAHFVIDRNLAATVYQCVTLSDTAWHASQANLHSIGIEHVALSEQGACDLNEEFATQIAAGTQKPWAYLPATEEQYKSSALLVAWLCRLLKIPCDRAHVRTHDEASPADHHVLCCTGALDPDRVVQMAQALG